MEPSTRTGSRAARSAGFTLIEVLVVMTILVILAAVGLARYNNSVKTSREAVLKTDLFQMREALDQYYADKGKYPSSLDALVEDKYMRAIPVDPITGKSDTWQTVLSDPEPGNPSAEVGIYDVKSGSDQTAIDNTRYSDW
jgi:general secretion pathway protein G